MSDFQVFILTLHVVMTRSSSDGVEIRYVFPVLWMTSLFSHNALYVVYGNVIYTSRAYATMSVSVCLSICVWRKCIGAL